LAEIGILIIDDDLSSQRALKNVLDAEGWRVRILATAAHALTELASGDWNLVIINVALTDLGGPLFAILRELVQAGEAADERPDEPTVAAEDSGDAAEVGLADPEATENGDGSNGAGAHARRRIRVLFLVPMLRAKSVVPALERDGLPYTVKPYHLHDFLEKVSELLQEAGAIAEPIRSMRDFGGRNKRVRDRKTSRDGRRGAMFASREDYQMTEEELVEWERQEEEDRKKRQKELQDREHR
jgi:PleD family two-component response regulator